MVRISKLIPLLIALPLAFTVVLADKKVNLILPTIIGAKVDNCINNRYVTTLCNLTVWTRASEYRLVDFDVEFGNSTGSIERIGDYKDPKDIREGQEIVRNNQRVSITTELDKAKGWVSQRETTDTVAPLTGKAMNWRICDAYATLQPNETEICIHDGALSILTKDGKQWGTIPMQMYFEAGEKRLAAPISAMVVLPRDNFQMTNLPRIELILFDVIGRMHICRYEILELASRWVLGSGIGREPYEFIDLSSIPSPSSGLRARQWQIKSNYLTPLIKTRLETGLNEKMNSAYIEAITPIFVKTKKIGAGITKRDVVIYQKNSNNVTVPGSVLPVLPADDSIALCFSRAYRMYDLKSNVICSYKGEDQSALVELPVVNLPASLTPDNTPAHIIHAYHIGSESGRRYFHLFYSYSRSGFAGTANIFYLFCSRPGELTGLPGVKGADLILNSGVGKKDCQPRTDKILNPPNDVIGFAYDKCNKVIAFYDFIYTVSNISTPLDTIGKGGKILPSLNFKISAAFSLDNKIYFFTQSNLLLIIEASMNAECSELTLNMNSMKRMFSEDFIFKNAFQKMGSSPLSAPYLIDYREYENGAVDTNPSIDMNSPEPKTPEVPGVGGGGGGKAGSKKGSSNIVIIAIGLIIGGLIIAAIIYLFCLRGKSDDDREPVRVRKSRKSPKMDPDLMIKTVRSKHTMNSPPSLLRNEASKGSKILPSNVSKVESMKSKKGPTNPSQMARSELSKGSKIFSTQKSMKSPKSPKSPNSPKSFKSHKSHKSPKSTQSQKSLKSPKKATK